MEEVVSTTEELLQAWRDAARAAELADRLASDALETAEHAESNATVSEEIAELAESAAAAAASTSQRAREAATMARARATDARDHGVPQADQTAVAAAADTAMARDLYHQRQEEARRRHVDEA